MSVHSLANTRLQPRELRRRVMLRARMRAMSGWTDACILNVSSRGLMINAPIAAGTQGSTIEIWHGEHMIVATVVWRKGRCVGLRADARIPVDDILIAASGPSLQLTAGNWPSVERRKTPRTQDERRCRGRVLEFAAVTIIAAGFALGAFLTIEEAFARPIRYVQAALG
jgi:hypothetical protein